MLNDFLMFVAPFIFIFGALLLSFWVALRNEDPESE